MPLQEGKQKLFPTQGSVWCRKDRPIYRVWKHFFRNPRQFSNPLANAIKAGDAKRVHEMLEEFGFDPNVPCNSRVQLSRAGWGYLHFAADVGDPDIILTLTEIGADVNAKNALEQTPLHLAAQSDHGHAVMKLIMLGADLQAKDIHDHTPSQTAENNGCARLLKAAESNFKEKFSEKIKKTCMIGDVRKLERMLREEGYDPNAYNELNVNYTYLHYAAKNGQDAVIRSLVKLGATLQPNVDGDTPLHVAAYYGQLDCVRTLVSLGCEINEENKDGRVPLHWAAHNGNVEVVDALLNLGANLLVADVKGLSPLAVARKRNLGDLVKHLEECISELYTLLEDTETDDPGSDLSLTTKTNRSGSDAEETGKPMSRVRRSMMSSFSANLTDESPSGPDSSARILQRIVSGQVLEPTHTETPEPRGSRVSERPSLLRAAEVAPRFRNHSNSFASPVTVDEKFAKAASLLAKRRASSVLSSTGSHTLTGPHGDRLLVLRKRVEEAEKLVSELLKKLPAPVNPGDEASKLQRRRSTKSKSVTFSDQPIRTSVLATSVEETLETINDDPAYDSGDDFCPYPRRKSDIIMEAQRRASLSSLSADQHKIQEMLRGDSEESEDGQDGPKRKYRKKIK
eukprot:Rmarinus@m.594